jgi:hypothetical protein
VRHVLILALFACTVGAGCRRKEAAIYPVTFRAFEDGRTPLEGVELFANGQTVGTTAGDGVLKVDLTGPEGALVKVTARCPKGYRSPERLPSLTLRKLLSLDQAVASRGIQVSVECRPELRASAVVIRTNNRADVPIIVDGRERARTDTSGAALIVTKQPPGSTFRVKLDTSTLASLKPQSPELTFTVPDSDEVFVFDQDFSEDAAERPKRHGKARRTKKKKTTTSAPRPVRLD